MRRATGVGHCRPARRGRRALRAVSAGGTTPYTNICGGRNGRVIWQVEGKDGVNREVMDKSIRKCMILTVCVS